MLANGGNIAVADHNGIVNGSYSLLKHFDIKLSGKKVYDCNDANHAVNIKGAMSHNTHARANENKLEKDNPTFSSCVGDFGRLFLSV